VEIVLKDGARVLFEDDEDGPLTTRFHHYNVHAFDGQLPPATLRWATVRNASFCSVYGVNVAQHESLATPHIFLDERLRDRRLESFSSLVLLHEMTHSLFLESEPAHGDAFMKAYLRALQRASWEPLMLCCVPSFKLAELE
jgi:hypothetical protein